jgi:hypothetical protein
MNWRPLCAGLAGIAVLLACGCSCHKRTCAPPPPPPCCPPGGATVTPGTVPPPPAPAVAPQYYSGPPMVNGMGH